MHHPLDHGDRGDEREHGHNPEQHDTGAPRSRAQYQRRHAEQQNALRALGNADLVLHAERFGPRPRVRYQERCDERDQPGCEGPRFHVGRQRAGQKIEDQPRKNRPLADPVECGIVKRAERRDLAALARHLPVEKVEYPTDQQQQSAEPDGAGAERHAGTDHHQGSHGGNRIRMHAARDEQTRQRSNQPDKPVLDALGNDIHAGGKLIARRNGGRVSEA